MAEWFDDSLSEDVRKDYRHSLKNLVLEQLGVSDHLYPPKPVDGIMVTDKLISKHIKRYINDV